CSSCTVQESRGHGGEIEGARSLLLRGGRRPPGRGRGFPWPGTPATGRKALRPEEEHGYNCVFTIRQKLMTQDQLKQAVAQAAVDYILPRLDSKSVIGVGTGSTANFFIDALARHKMAFDGAVASSEATAARLRGHGIPVYDLNGVDGLEF